MSTATAAPQAPRIDPTDEWRVEDRIHTELFPLVTSVLAHRDRTDLPENLAFKLAEMAMDARRALADEPSVPPTRTADVRDAMALLTAIAAAAVFAGRGALHPEHSVVPDEDRYRPGPADALQDLVQLATRAQKQWPPVTDEAWIGS